MKYDFIDERKGVSLVSLFVDDDASASVSSALLLSTSVKRGFVDVAYPWYGKLRWIRIWTVGHFTRVMLIILDVLLTDGMLLVARENMKHGDLDIRLTNTAINILILSQCIILTVVYLNNYCALCTVCVVCVVKFMVIDFGGNFCCGQIRHEPWLTATEEQSQ